jgi:hypothetical protein
MIATTTAIGAAAASTKKMMCPTPRLPRASSPAGGAALAGALVVLEGAVVLMSFLSLAAPQRRSLTRGDL